MKFCFFRIEKDFDFLRSRLNYVVKMWTGYFLFNILCFKFLLGFILGNNLEWVKGHHVGLWFQLT